jgi:hypothetical protein
MKAKYNCSKILAAQTSADIEELLPHVTQEHHYPPC